MESRWFLIPMTKLMTTALMLTPNQLSYVARLFDTQATGILLDGRRTERGGIPFETLVYFWRTGTRVIPDSIPLPVRNCNPAAGRNINDRIMEILGSKFNTSNLFLVQRELKEAKGRVFNDQKLFFEATHDLDGRGPPQEMFS